MLKLIIDHNLFLELFPVVPIITIPPRPIAVQEGHNMEFKCFAIGTPTPAIQWEYRGKMVGRGNILTIGTFCKLSFTFKDDLICLFFITENADESDQGEYLCIAISSAGSSSVATRLTVFSKYSFMSFLNTMLMHFLL